MNNDKEKYSLSFWSYRGSYRHHDGLSFGEAKYYYLKYCKYGDVEITYRNYDGFPQEVNPNYFFRDEDEGD